MSFYPTGICYPESFGWKVNRWIYIALYYKPFISKALRYGPCVTTGSHSFTCHPHTNYTCLYSPATRHHRPFWYSLRLPTKGWPGWVDLGGWSHIEINVPHRELNLDTVTHPSTNRARRRLTSLMCAVLLPLSQATTRGFTLMWGSRGKGKEGRGKEMTEELGCSFVSVCPSVRLSVCLSVNVAGDVLLQLHCVSKISSHLLTVCNF